MDINKLRTLAGLQEEAEWHGPYGFNTADGTFPLYVDDPELISRIEHISAMAENDELAYWGGIDTDPEDLYDDEDPIRITTADVEKAEAALGDDLHGEDPIDDDIFLNVWQNILGLF